MTALMFVAGWICGAATVAFLLGAAIGLADKHRKQQPEGVVDPETGAIWTETKRLDVNL